MQYKGKHSVLKLSDNYTIQNIQNGQNWSDFFESVDMTEYSKNCIGQDWSNFLEIVDMTEYSKNSKQLKLIKFFEKY